MIYLLEDRRDRFEQQLKVKLDETLIKTDAVIKCTKNEVKEYVEKNFPNVKLLLLHRSYNFLDNDITPLYIQSVFNNLGASVVIFSGDNSSNVSGNNGTINSNDLYANLPWFVSQKDETNISKLVFGEKYILDILLSFQSKVFEKLFMKGDSEVLEKKEIGELKFLLPNLKAPELADIKSNIKDILNSENSITGGLLKDYIQYIIDQQ